MNKRVAKIGWIVLAALLCLSLILVPGCTTPSEQEEEEEEPLPSVYIGSGKLDGEGIPVDFFSDVNVRIGCCYAFDYDTYIKDALLNEGARRGSPIIYGITYYNPDASMYEYDLVKAQRYLKLAWDGELWEKGFKCTLCYNAGNLERKTACEILAEGLYAVNEKFQVSITPLAWPTMLYKMYGTLDMPMFSIGWITDYPHADNWVVPYMHSHGTFSEWQGYGYPELDAKIEAAFKETDLVKQQEKYYELQEIYYEEAPAIVLAQTLGRRYFTKYIEGFEFNPVHAGDAGNIWDLRKVEKPEVDIPFKNPDTFIQMTIGDAESMDPAWQYDNASLEQAKMIYNTLIYYDGTAQDEFMPLLATEWEFNSTDLTYRFKIREGVKFHEGGDLTPEDVEYSFERAMVQDRPGGPVWMFFQPLLDVWASSQVTFADIDGAVEVDGDWVQFNLKGGAHWEIPFLQILSGGWASIVDKEWCIAQDDWDGTEATWEDYNKPLEPGDTVLFDKTNGTGPWKLEQWEQGIQIKLVRNDNYWGDPAPFERVITKIVEEWTSRKLALLAGDADYVYVPRSYIGELEGVQDINLYKDLPTLNLDAFFFNMAIGGKSEE